MRGFNTAVRQTANDDWARFFWWVSLAIFCPCSRAFAPEVNALSSFRAVYPAFVRTGGTTPERSIRGGESDDPVSHEHLSKHARFIGKLVPLLTEDRSEQGD